nr:2Fe-2S iron-sulfur cluster-binding protein [Polaromonas jejuensis]
MSLPLPSPPENAASPVFSARVEPDGFRFEAPASQPLLQAAELAGLALANSCRNGTCRTCICQLSKGQVVYRIEWPGLSAEEKQAGYILPCVAYPLSDVVIERSL